MHLTEAARLPLFLMSNSLAATHDPFLGTDKREQKQGELGRGQDVLDGSRVLHPAPTCAHEQAQKGAGRTMGDEYGTCLMGPVFNALLGSQHLRVQWCALPPLVTLTVPGASLWSRMVSRFMSRLAHGASHPPCEPNRDRPRRLDASAAGCTQGRKARPWERFAPSPETAWLSLETSPWGRIRLTCMDQEDRTGRERKERLRQRRDAAGLAQVSGWVPKDRRPYAREVLAALARGANSLPPDPEQAAALAVAQSDVAAARIAEAAACAALVEAERYGQVLIIELDVTRAESGASREAGRQAEAAAMARAEAAEGAREAIAGELRAAEVAVTQAQMEAKRFQPATGLRGWVARRLKLY